MDLEIWLMGTPHEVERAMAALDAAGRIEGASVPEPLCGADSGRVRRYLRVRVPITASGSRPQNKAAGANPSRSTLHTAV